MAKPTTLSAVLKRYRAAAGLTQQALADRAGVSVRAISDLERGLHRAARASTIDLLTSALALSPEQRAVALAAARPELALPDSADVHTSPRMLIRPPAATTALLGRERELMVAREALLGRGVRLLTVTGPGGVGKTRLALQFAEEVATAFPDGVVFVDLAPLSDATQLGAALALALGLREGPEAPLTTSFERALEFLRERRVLLLLDNFEHVLDSAPQIARLLAECSQLYALVTSRAPLRVRGEWRLPLQPLEAGAAADLFRARANAAQPDRALPGPEVAAICAQLDHLPLAIELAAAQLSALSAMQLRERLAQRLPSLISGMRDLPARQQTMEATIAWSYALLDDERQRWFRALSVFAGGWTAEAAQAVCGDDSGASDDVTSTLVTLADLADASLIQAHEDVHGVTRFSQLELLRAFGRERLREAGEERLRCERHARYYVRLAETITRDGPSLRVPRRDADPDAVAELANARAALEWAEAANEPALGLRLAGIGRLWHVVGQMQEALDWMTRMLALDERQRAEGMDAAPLELRVHGLHGHARTLLGYGDYERAEAHAVEAVRLLEDITDDYLASNALMTLGMVMQAVGRLDDAASAFTASYERMQEGDVTGQRYRARSKLAEIAALQGHLADASAMLERALADAEVIDNQWDVAHMATLLGGVACQMQRYQLATQRYQRALSLYRVFASPRFSAWCLEGYAAVLAGEDHYALATRLCAAAATFREQAQTPAPPVEREAVEQLMAAARSALGRERCRQLWQAGAARSQDDALADALAACVRRLDPERIDR
jgi:predicted ATPase/DNA-binding XRE family transcriptional regulator